MNNKWLVIGLVVLAVLGLVGYQKFMANPATITVTGSGKAMVKPGYVTMIVSKVSVNNDVTAAIDDSEANMTKLMTLATRVGGEGVEIKKSFYQITPESGTNLVANAFSIKSKNVSGVTSMIKQFYQMGATSVSNVTFLPEDADKVESDARKSAVEDAKKQGQKIAASVGKRLGGVVTIADDQAGASSTVSDVGGADNSQITVSKTVTVAYELF
jgi:uncharacterized protein